jgi:hypothetical protein
MTETEYKEETYLLNKDLGVVSVPNSNNMEDVILL